MGISVRRTPLPTSSDLSCKVECGCYLWGMSTHLLFVLCTEFLIGSSKGLPGTLSLFPVCEASMVWCPEHELSFPWFCPTLWHGRQEQNPCLDSRCTAHCFHMSPCPFLFFYTVTIQAHTLPPTSDEGSLRVVLSPSFLACLVFSTA